MIKTLLIVAIVLGISITIPMIFFGMLTITIAIKGLFDILREW